jgi:hypothetical protein
MSEKHGSLVYVVHAKRYGEDASQSYIVGVFKTKRKAIDAAEKEEEWRGKPKYLCEVWEMELGIADGTRQMVRSCGRERFPDLEKMGYTL